MDKFNNSSQNLGILAEEIARYYLIKKKYRIIASNYKKQWGEIDIIAEKEDVLTFFEVKANRGEYKGQLDFSPQSRVNALKQEKIIKTAEFYIRDNNLTDREWQVDILSITFDSEKQKAKIKHFKRI